MLSREAVNTNWIVLFEQTQALDTISIKQIVMLLQKDTSFQIKMYAFTKCILSKNKATYKYATIIFYLLVCI